MFDPRFTEEDDKLLLLVAMGRLGSCTQEQLMRYAVETQLLPQFRFLLALGDLRDAGLVRETKRLEGVLLTLTPEGRQSAELFGGRLRASQLATIGETATDWRRRFLDELNTPADWEETEDGYVAHLRVLESGAKLLEMNVAAATRAQAKRFCERWPQRAAIIYQTIMGQLGEIAEEQSAESEE